MERKAKKLVLSRETLHAMAPLELGAVQGGATIFTNPARSCPCFHSQTCVSDGWTGCDACTV